MLAASPTFASDMPPAAPIVRLECGPAAGVRAADGRLSWLGVPYAQPPTGERRWQPPEPLAPGRGCWQGTLDASTPHAACLQHGRFSGVASSEDCLRVHVFTPTTRSPATHSLGGRPVFVWLHGGDLIEGSGLSIQSGFGAEGNLTAPPVDAVVVAVEYRLGIAGFLALDALADRDRRGRGLVGNYGLLDVMEALRWVQRNVAAFGGAQRTCAASTRARTLSARNATRIATRRSRVSHRQATAHA
eukprot:4364776-Prymnesium_polylepis.1